MDKELQAYFSHALYVSKDQIHIADQPGTSNPVDDSIKIKPHDQLTPVSSPAMRLRISGLVRGQIKRGATCTYVPFEENKERSQQHVRAIETYTSLMCDPQRHYCGGAKCVVPATLAPTTINTISYFIAVFTQKIMVTLWLTPLFINHGLSKRC